MEMEWLPSGALNQINPLGDAGLEDTALLGPSLRSASPRSDPLTEHPWLAIDLDNNGGHMTNKGLGKGMESFLSW